MSASVSTPNGEAPSTTPSTPRPSSVCATITCVGLAVAQRWRTSGDRDRTLDWNGKEGKVEGGREGAENQASFARPVALPPWWQFGPRSAPADGCV